MSSYNEFRFQLQGVAVRPAQSQSRKGSRFSSKAEVGMLISKHFLPRRLTTPLGLTIWWSYKLTVSTRNIPKISKCDNMRINITPSNMISTKLWDMGPFHRRSAVQAPRTSGCNSPMMPILMPEQMICACIPGKKASALSGIAMRRPFCSRWSFGVDKREVGILCDGKSTMASWKILDNPSTNGGISCWKIIKLNEAYQRDPESDGMRLRFPVRYHPRKNPQRKSHGF